MTETMIGLLGEEFPEMLTRIILATVLSGLIGFERELKRHQAGFRTHILVGVGACMMMLLSVYGFEAYIDQYDNIRFDPARIPSYVISGIGFLGAGTIMVHGMTIRGLTTAASIWTVAGLGLVVGAGLYPLAILTTIIVLLSLVFLTSFEKLFAKNKNKNKNMIHLIVDNKANIGEILDIFETNNVNIKRLEIEQESIDNRNIYIEIEKDQLINRSEILSEISRRQHVTFINGEK